MSARASFAEIGCDEPLPIHLTGRELTETEELLSTGGSEAGNNWPVDEDPGFAPVDTFPAEGESKIDRSEQSGSRPLKSGESKVPGRPGATGRKPSEFAKAKSGR